MKKRIKIILFTLLLILLWLPALQQLTGIFKDSGLNGAFEKPEKPVLSDSTWNSGEYQKKLEEYENYNFGFRGLAVKIKNSLAYILFTEISTGDEIAGRDGYIFSLASVEMTITGLRYEGKQRNDTSLSRINFLKKEIEKGGGHFLTVIAPSKESIMPEKLPAAYDKNVKRQEDYFDILQGLSKYQIPFIDFNAYFKELRHTIPYPLFTKTGFHWSLYGASIAQDSILSYMQHFLPSPMPSYLHKGVEFSDTAHWPDADFELPMNLLFSLQDHRYVYPKIEMVPSTLATYSPRVIVIGDSFFWVIKDLRNIHSIFSKDSKYWFYFKTEYSLSDNSSIPIKNVDVITEIENADYVILFASLGTLWEFPYGFADYYYSNADKGIIGLITEGIENNPEWFAAVKDKAKIENDSLEPFIAAEARRIYRSRKIIHLKASNNKFLCADASVNNNVLASKDDVWTWETFSLFHLYGDKYALLSYANKFLTAELGRKTEITATRAKIRGWETWQMTNLDSNEVAFKTSNGKFIGVDEKSHGLFANADSIGAQEKFKVITSKLFLK